MDDTARLLMDATTRLFDGQCGEEAQNIAAGGGWLTDEWATIVEMGLPLALVPEDKGGFGVGAADALATVRLAGRYVIPLPIGDMLIANRLLAMAGFPLLDGIGAIVPICDMTLTREGDAWRLRGAASRVAWGRFADVLVVEAVCDNVRYLARVTKGGWAKGGWDVTECGANLAGHARDTLTVNAWLAGEDVVPSPSDLTLHAQGAAIRTIQSAGALEQMLDMTVTHVSDRVQFGKSLSRQQAVQHELARFATSVAASVAAADIAVDALAGPSGDPLLRIAAGRIRMGEATGLATGIAHQLHGAMGFTMEHRLHRYSRALWSWREEFGGHGYWTAMLGDAAFERGDDYWSFVTAI